MHKWCRGKWMAHECAWSFSQGIPILIFVSLQLGGKLSVLEGVTDNIMHYFGLEEVQYFGICILFNSDFFNLWSRLNCFLNYIRSIKHSDNIKARFQVEYDKNGRVWFLDFHLNLTRCNFSVLYYTWNTNLSGNTYNKETREEDECSYGTFHGVLENFICTCHDAFRKVRSHN